MIYIFLADGFEEVEALTPCDLLRRCGADVKLIGVDKKIIKGAHGIFVTTDLVSFEVEPESGLDAVILPGGKDGTANLKKNEVVDKFLDYAADNEVLIGAICAAPTVLGAKGLLDGKKATCYPGEENKLGKAEFKEVKCVRDGNIITACSAGEAMTFGFELVKYLFGEDKAKYLRETWVCDRKNG